MCEYRLGKTDSEFMLSSINKWRELENLGSEIKGLAQSNELFYSTNSKCDIFLAEYHLLVKANNIQTKE